jgi:uncharacterized membrane protein YvlD (DUF360 family)
VIRFVALAVVNLIANAIALVVTAQLLDDMALDAGGLLLAVVVFTVVEVLVEPFFRQQAILTAPALLGSTALVATLASLIVTTALTDGLRISGAFTWVIARCSCGRSPSPESCSCRWSCSNEFWPTPVRAATPTASELPVARDESSGELARSRSVMAAPASTPSIHQRERSHRAVRREGYEPVPRR